VTVVQMRSAIAVMAGAESVDVVVPVFVWF